MTVSTNLGIMEKMKQYVLIFTAIMFLANTFAVSAWAKPCMGMNPVSSVTQMSDADMPPCHEDKQQQESSKHCDGLCLCAHAAINQTLTLTDSADFQPPAIKADHAIMPQTDVAFWASYPPLRPPIKNS